MKPLEQSIGIESSFTAKQLFAYLNKFVEKTPELKLITGNDEYQKALHTCCLFYEKFPLLQQNLTILALRARVIYQQSIFSALMGLAIAVKIKMSITESQCVFVAGLFHDIGFLYLAPEIRDKNQEFSNEEWKALQAHPLIAQKFLSLVPVLPNEIGQAIAHHHERIDGTGYPYNLFGDSLSITSQIIALTNNIQFNQVRYSGYEEHVYSVILIALKLSDNIYYDSVYDAALMLIKLVPLPETLFKYAPHASKLLTRQKTLRKEFERIKFLAQQLNTYSKNPNLRSINAVMGRLGITIVRSGILQEEQDQLLAIMATLSTPNDGLMLAEIGVMHDQIFDQLLHLKNLMDRIVESIPSTESTFKTLAIKALKEINLHESIAA